MMYSQTWLENGDRKENMFGDFLSGRLYSMLMPRLRNGIVKSMTCSR